jgi:FAD/FMN-containing dehydrogenase
MFSTSTDSVKSIFSSSQNLRVNDVHSQLNPTVVKARILPGNESSLVDTIKKAYSDREQICIAGGRHSMGGQQFLDAGVLLDMTDLKNVLQFDSTSGLIEVESGTLWPDLIAYLRREQVGREIQWTIAQKQTGCDQLSIGGALASNIHGRGLSRPPIVDDVESFRIVLHDGQVISCDRRTNSELFSLVIGGYGLFGVILSVTLRLVPRTVLRRTVELVDADDIIAKLDERVRDGAAYGDFQFSIDDRSVDFLNMGILSTYEPVEEQDVVSDNRLLSTEDWRQLLFLAHTDKSAAFAKYAQHYLGTNGQLYWSDTFQLATYLEDYHSHLDASMPASAPGTELISEFYVPREALSSFLRNAAELLRDREANVIYGTVRLIETDNQSFLAWAKQRWACIVLNLHVEHSSAGIAAVKRCFSELIELAIQFGGSYYLTYHRFASRRQLLTCYPEFPQFLQEKAKYDPRGLFSSNWYRHCQHSID